MNEESAKETRAVKNPNVELFPAPDGHVAVQLSDFHEPNNGNTLCRIALVDFTNRMLDQFEGLTGFGAFGCWNSASSVFILPAGRHDCVFLYNVFEKSFGLVRVSSGSYLKITFVESDTFEIGVLADSLAAANSQFVFGGGLAEFPIERFRTPDRLRLRIGMLVWHSRNQLSHLGQILDKLPLLNMNLVPDGFFEFNGKFPETTVDKINGRLMTIWHLESFTEYGDPQASAWLDDVKKIAGDRLNRQHSVMRYLGELRRELPLPLAKS